VLETTGAVVDAAVLVERGVVEGAVLDVAVLKLMK
jgi:hypothetical protein